MIKIGIKVFTIGSSYILSCIFYQSRLVISVWWAAEIESGKTLGKGGL